MGPRDPCRGDAGWAAFTTDTIRQDLAWVVRSHPIHGRSVLLFRNRHVADQHTAWCGPSLLFRAGAYWWDGHMWFGPLQLWDAPPDMIGEAELRFCMPRDVVQNSIRTALSLDSQLDAETIDRLLDKVLPPNSDGG